MDKTKRYVDLALLKWRDLGLSTKMPKIHAIEDHLVKQMSKFKGIGCFTEEFIEQNHQFGFRNNIRTRNMKDKVLSLIHI